jgi:hypothetical protein
MLLEVLRKLKIFCYLVGIRNRDLPACSTAPQPTTVACHRKEWYPRNICRTHAVTCCGLQQSVSWRVVSWEHNEGAMKYCRIRWGECPSVTLHANFVSPSPASRTNVLRNSVGGERERERERDWGK